MNLFDGKILLLQKGLDAAWKRNKVIANNIANVDTPNFKASKVEFESILKDKLSGAGGVEMKRTSERHLSSPSDSLEPVVTTNDSVSMRLDGNNVDIENEMAELTKNNILYQLMVQMVSKGLYKYKYVINEGKM